MLYPSREVRRGLGLVSTIEFKCTVCDIEIVKSTENPNCKKSVINTGAVWGTMATGSTYAHLEELLSCIDIPCLNKYTYSNVEVELNKVWHNQILVEMEKAGIKEKQKAIENNDIDSDGVPYITVYLDGGWSKRSYGHNYNAASGVAVIIGKYTGKVVYMGVRNKYCVICTRAANQEKNAKQHICYKNWSGSSSAMEQDIIVAGFQLSEEQHGLRYKKMIADGDSSVWANIRNKVSYGQYVEKIECTNHAIKNYGKRLYNIKKDNAVSLIGRKQLTQTRIIELQRIAQSAIYNSCYEEDPVTCLERDVLTGIDHVFGHHEKCSQYFCKSIGDTKSSILDAVVISGLYHHLKSSVEILLRKSSRLITNETNNRAELFMSILARFNGGKRLNLTNRGSFGVRSELAALRYDNGVSWHYSPYKKVMSASPGVYFKKFIQRSQRVAELRRAKTSQKQSKPKTRSSKIENKDYGKFSEQVEPSAEEIQRIKERTLEDLKVDVRRQLEIAKLTVGQFSNDLYKVERSQRLTASYFGKVVHRNNSTRCHSLVKDILYPSSFSTSATEYGKIHESVAIGLLEKKLNTSVSACGLYIDLNYSHLAASPDGFVGETHCVEVKTIPKLVKAGLSLREGTEKGMTFLRIDDNGEMSLKRNHSYYCQIQGQLNIVNRQKCYLVVYVSDHEDIFVEEIQRDEDYWRNIMVPKLNRFYYDCILEEIARRRHLHGKKCYDPIWIEEAIREKEQKKTKTVT